MRDRREGLDGLGVDVVAVAPTAAYQAQHLMQTGIPFPCLLDPERNLYRALDLGRIKAMAWLRLDTYRNYLRAVGRARQGLVSASGAVQRPGLVIVEPNGRLAYIHRGDTVGDYPNLDGVIARLRLLTITPE